MIESIQSFVAASAIPNLHAIILHFPLALLPTALAADFACLLFRKRIWLDRTATTLYVVGTLGAGAAFLSGELASEAIAAIPAAAEAALADHQDLARLTLISYSIVALLRMTVTWLAREDWRLKLGFFRLTALVTASMATVFLVLTADQGSALVYRHGLAVEAVRPERAPTATPSPTPGSAVPDDSPSEIENSKLRIEN